jgi:hypothetical protein
MTSRRAYLRTVFAFALTLALASGLALGARYGLVERDDLGAACDVADPQWWCRGRMLLIHGFVFGVYGWASIACALLAVVRRSATLALVAIVIGTFGMVLYDFTWAGVGVVGGALALARAHEPRHEHRQA